jgi:segregation and condensation protein A
MEPNDVDDPSLMTAELDAPPDNPDGRRSQSPDTPVPPASAGSAGAEGVGEAGVEGTDRAGADAAEPPSENTGTPNGAPAASASGAPGSAPSAKLQSTLDDGYRVALPMFEGPLDLLLHLVKKHELDILNIPIAFITERYVAYIKLLDELNIDVASEYLLMAATLVHIKSRMLLPNAPSDETDETLDEADVDPRAELVRRLLEYQKYKLAAEQLGGRNLLGRDVFPRGSSEEVASGQPGLEAVSMFKLLDAFQQVLERTQKTQEHQIDFERFSITEKISELVDRLNVEKKLVFHEIFTPDSSRAELIITFLAILEMTRLRLTRLSQDGPLAPIYIELRILKDEAEDEATTPSDESEESAGDDQEYD